MKLSDYINYDKNEKPLENIKETCGFLNIFKSIGVIGDSLSSGTIEKYVDGKQVDIKDKYEYSWPSILHNLNNSTLYNYSRGGMRAKDHILENKKWEKCDAYIIFLGNNDLFNEDIKYECGSIKDINQDDSKLNKDIYFGYMDKIIKKIKNINEMAYIFIVPVQYENDINKNELVFYVANELKKFEKIYSKLFILDIVNNGIAFDKEFKDKYCVGFHPNPMGYYLIALMFGNYIDYIIRHNINLFIESGYLKL